MPRFEHSRERKRKTRDSPRRNSRSNSRDDSSSNKTFEDWKESGGGRSSGRRRDSDRGSRRSGGNLEFTKVICSDCGVECEVPFKPTSSKPVYCSDCFEKKDQGGFDRPSNRNQSSNRDLDIINEKLNKIMEALKIK